MRDPDRRTLLINGGLALGLAALAPRIADAGEAASVARPASRTIAIDPLSLVAPELRPALDRMRNALPDVKFDAKGLATLRNLRFPGAPGPAGSPSWVRRLVPGPRGAPDVPAWVINASQGAARKPAVLHLHGGGFVAGSAETGIPALQALALAHDCVVVTVDYRLAPETPFPGALEDNYAALRWLHASADELGVDASRIAVMGESAGGGHAAMLALAARDRGEFRLAAQVLSYPMLDDRTGSTRTVPAHIGTFLWTRTLNRDAWSALLGVPAGSRRVPAGAVPARVADLAGLPPTFIGVGALDLFVEEDMQYAQRLVAAGVPTSLLVVPGAFHGFDHMAPDAPQSRQFHEALGAALSRALAPAS